MIGPRHIPLLGSSMCLVGILAGLWTSPALQAASEDKDEGVPLQFKLPSDQTQTYSWEVTSHQSSKGMDLGKKLDLKSDKSMKMTVLLRGGKSKLKKGVLAILRFQGLEMIEDRQAGKDTKTYLKVGRNTIYSKENDRVLIDSQNDIGLDKITDYQRQMRGMEKGELRVELDRTGRPMSKTGESALMETLHGGNAQSIFPVLPEQQVKLKETWDSRFQIRSLGDLKLNEPAIVLTRARLAEWQTLEGRKVALIEVVSAWETDHLTGRDKQGLSVTISELKGLGSGVCTFDPAEGRFLEGSLSFKMDYRMEGSREGETTNIDVEGKTRFTFKLLPKGPMGPAPK